ncbi:heterokaryon incompatibility protein-domain-containing protein [Sordaria brevicollis]|uniref:Heterokaryon incompatibility protein-domain-containing protein n=1 Tax=Sordaria brevicollis TaxID=83679 RepID=A0AAE0PJ40_SORBR|nr:heterokaryon incompatibility protein-domain-containing protein [Sordaria brevicollis]
MGKHQSCIHGATDTENLPPTARYSLRHGKTGKIVVTRLPLASESSRLLVKKLPLLPPRPSRWLNPSYPESETMGNYQSCTHGATDAWSIPATDDSLEYGKQDELTVAHWSSASDNSSLSLINNSSASGNNMHNFHLGEKSRGICERCNAIDLRQILSTPSRPNHPRSMEIWHLGEVDSYDCALCSFFTEIRRRWLYWSYFEPSAPYPDHGFHIRRYVLARKGVCSLTLFAIDEMKGTSGLLSGEVDPKTSTNMDNPWWFLPEPSSLVPIDRWICSDPSLKLKALPLYPALINYPLLRAWIQECEGHSACGRHANANLNQLHRGPVIRAIDCKTRTIVELLPNDKYLALSYVWGRRTMTKPKVTRPKDTEHLRESLHISDRIKLLEENMPAVIENVPEVVEDALLVVEQLGERYLWVDQYCIDQNNAQDKHHQIRNMDTIYERAYATIVPFSGEHSGLPLPGVTTSRCQQPRFQSPETTLLGFKAGISSSMVKSSV